jgi:hypothetical protein
MTAAVPHHHRFRSPLLLLPLLLLAATTSPAQTAPSTAPTTVEPYRPTLLAYGSPDHYWIARVETYQDGARARMRTLLRGQDLPAGDWMELPTIYGHAVGLAESRGELALLLDDGSWKRLGAAGLATGPVIPGTGPVLAWASNAHDLYAVRNVEGGIRGVTTRPVEAPPPPRPAATTRASTTTQRTRTTPSIATRPAALLAQAAATSRPTTRPSRLTLLHFQRGEWAPIAELPDGAAGSPIALAVVGGKPLLAISGRPATSIRTFVWSDGAWQPFGAIPTGARPGRFELVSGAMHPALWTIDADGVMKLFLKREGDNWTAAPAFALPANLPENAQRTLVATGQDFRLVVRKDANILERRYDSAGAPRSDLAQLPAPQSNRPDAMFWIVRAFVILLMVIVMLLTFYHRRGPPEPTPDDDDNR